MKVNSCINAISYCIYVNKLNHVEIPVEWQIYILKPIRLYMY